MTCLGCAGGAPEKLIVLMEGESLFNDATSIVLFEIFFRMVKRLQNGETPSDLGIFGQMADIASSICWLTFGELLQLCFAQILVLKHKSTVCLLSFAAHV